MMDGINGKELIEKEIINAERRVFELNKELEDIKRKLLEPLTIRPTYLFSSEEWKNCPYYRTYCSFDKYFYD